MGDRVDTARTGLISSSVCGWSPVPDAPLLF
jgi:hypothetical protein